MRVRTASRRLDHGMRRPCEVEACAQNGVSKGLCPKHYSRMLRTGTTDDSRLSHGSLSERFWRHVSPDVGDACWEWQAGVNQHGYGRLGHLYAHRASWQIHNGPIPDRMFVLHSCDNPPCCKPSHLRLGTQADNIRDAQERGRLSRTIKSAAKIDEQAAREIRALASSGVRTLVLAERFGISQRGIQRVLSGVTWGRAA